MICPNCDEVLNFDEQLVVRGEAIKMHMHPNKYMVDHVSITSQPNISIKFICVSKSYSRFSFN